MNVKHDQSLIGCDSRELIEHGYGCIAVEVLRLAFLYPPAQDQGQKKVSPQQRNRIMKAVMDTIADRFPCYQYNVPRGMKYHSQDWSLFFWCRDLPPTGERDYSYITLSFNSHHTREQQQEICNQVLGLISERFSTMDSLEVTLQYAAFLDKEKISRDAAQAAPALDGEQCVYCHHAGRLVYVQDNLYFMKKYAKRKGYLLAPADVLRMKWQLSAAA